MKILFFYLSLLSIMLVCSHPVAMEAATKEESPSLQREKKGLLNIWNKGLSRSLFAIVHVITSVLFMLLTLFKLMHLNTKTKSIFFILFRVFPILFGMLILQLRLNDAKLSKKWHIPHLCSLFITIVLPFILYGNNTNNRNENLKKWINQFCKYLFFLSHAVVAILPIIGPLWYPSVSDEATNNLQKKSWMSFTFSLR